SMNGLERLQADRMRQSGRAALALDDRAARSLKSAGDPSVSKSRLLSPGTVGHLLGSDAVRNTRTDELNAQEKYHSDRNIGIGYGPVPAHLVLALQATTRQERRIGSQILPAIAVVPFSVSNSHSGRNIIGHLLAHEIIARLSRANEFDVISRLSPGAMCGRGPRLSGIGAALGADYVLWGNCEVKRDHLSVHFELANSSTQTVIWAGSLRAPLRAVREGYDGLVAHIVAETTARVLMHELPWVQSHPLETLENYSLMLAAINLLHRTQPSNFTHAHRLLELLIERLPHHALPQAWMAHWHIMKVSQGWSDDVAAEGRLALDCARRAGDSDPNCSLAIAMDGWVHTHLFKRFDIAI